MRLFIAAAALTCLFAGRAMAECDCGYPEHRPQPCRRCVEKHIYVPVEPKREEVARPEGGYAAPPQNGVLAGESAGVGLEGFEIEFPKLSLKFPSIRFPRLTHFRQGPRMLVESAEAPWVENFRDEASIEVARPEIGPAGPSNEESAPKPCDLPPKPPCAALPASSPSDVQMAELGTLYAQQLTQLREMETRLDAKVDRLAQVLQQINALDARTTASPAKQQEPNVEPTAAPATSFVATTPAKPIAYARVSDSANTSLTPSATPTVNEEQNVRKPQVKQATPSPAKPFLRFPQTLNLFGRNRLQGSR